MAALLVFIIATLEILAEKNCRTQKVQAPAKITSKAGDETSSVKL